MRRLQTRQGCNIFQKQTIMLVMRLCLKYLPRNMGNINDSKPNWAFRAFIKSTTATLHWNVRYKIRHCRVRTQLTRLNEFKPDTHKYQLLQRISSPPICIWDRQLVQLYTLPQSLMATGKLGFDTFASYWTTLDLWVGAVDEQKVFFNALYICHSEGALK